MNIVPRRGLSRRQQPDCPNPVPAAQFQTGAVPLRERQISTRSRALKSSRLLLGMAFLGPLLSEAKETTLVETKATSPSSILNQKDFDAIPSGRRPWDILQQAPGVLAEQVNIAGAPSNRFTLTGPFDSSNLFLVDGIAVNAQIGQVPGLFIEDAVQETGVSISPISPEYGRFAGGVVNFVTRSGGNEAPGALRFDFINGEPATNAPITAAGGGGDIYPATLGGPLVKDRLWFTMAGRDVNAPADRFAVINNSVKNRYSLLSGDRQMFLGPGQTVTFDLPKFGGFNVSDTGGDLRKLTYGSVMSQPNTMGIVTPNWAWDKTYTSVGSGERGLLTYNTDFAIPQDVNRWGDYSSLRPADKPFNYFLSTGSFGRHDLKIGYDGYVGISSSSRPLAASGITFIGFKDQAAASKQRPTITANYSSYYVNDRWRLNERWSMNLGVRYEKAAEPGESFSLGDGSAWRSRDSFQGQLTRGLGLDFDPSGNGKTVLRGGYGIYYDTAFQQLQPGVQVLGMNGGVNFTGIIGTGSNGGPAVYQPNISLNQDFYAAGACRSLPDNWKLGFGGAAWTKSAYPKLDAFKVDSDCAYRLQLGFAGSFKPISMEDQFLRDVVGQYAGYKPITGLNQVFPNIIEFNLPAHVAAPAPQSARLPNDAYFHSRDRVKQGAEDQWGLKRIGFKAAGRDGKGLLWPKQATPVIVAVVDSGVDIGHPDLQRQLWANFREIPNNGKDDDGNGLVDDVLGWNFVQGNNDVRDLHGHGSFVAGIIAAAPDNALGIAGVNPWARIMPVKVAGFTGDSSNVRIAMGISYAARMGAKVINVSLSGKGDSKAVRVAVDEATARGALVVVAAGNDAGDVKNAFPGNTPGVITVAATGPDDRREGYSNYGDRIDVAAPGSDILSLRATGTDFLRLELRDYKAGANVVDDILYHTSGTSFAAPFVAGVASLLLSVNPKLTAEQVRRMILNSARDIDVPGVDRNTGYGLLDAAAALAADPAFFIETAIADVAPAQGEGGTVVRVTGTADASEFARAWIELGAGAEVREFKPAGAEIRQAVRNGTLTDIPAASFQGSKEWVLRLVTEHKNGQRRENRFVLKLG